MVDIEALTRAGYSQEVLKQKFEAEELDPKIEELVRINAHRIEEGWCRNLNETRVYRAIDEAMNVSQAQVSYTLVRDLLNHGCSFESVKDKFTSWGKVNDLDKMMYTVCKADGTPEIITKDDGSTCPRKAIDLPTFFHIFLPVVYSYTNIRAAKLFNDRDQYPLDKYEPLRLTKKDRLRCQIVTSLMERSNTQVGTRQHRRQACMEVPRYGSALAFPLEDYHIEKQQFIDESGNIQEISVREGVRWSLPHPTRRFWDQNYDISTINTDTGCEYYGYWTHRRWSEIQTDESLWNRDKVSFTYSSRFLELWNVNALQDQCAVKFPTTVGETQQIKDRQAQAYLYTTEDGDKPVTVSVVFHKLVPKDWGLYDYPFPVWHRFIYAGPKTVVDCRPWAYTPGVAYVGDYNLNDAAPSPLALRILPFQDHLSNFMSQYILSIQSNLDQAVFVNTDMVAPEYIEMLKNLGEKRYRSRCYLPYSAQERRYATENQLEAFLPVKFERIPVEDISRGMAEVLAMMERMLGFSAQELGQAASHEQSAHEVRVIQSNTGEMLKWMGGSIDDGIWAQKQRNYEAFMAYGSDEVLAEVALMHEETDTKALQDLGFEVEDQDEKTPKAGVKGSKKTLRIHGFASRRDGEDRIPDEKIATAMLQTFQALFSNAAIVEVVGFEHLMDMYNKVLDYIGVPDDWRATISPETKQRLKEQNDPQMQQQAAQEMQQQIAQIAATIADQKIAQVAEQAIVPMREESQAMQQALLQFKQQLEQLGQATTVVAQKSQQSDEMLAEANMQQEQKFAVLTQAIQQLQAHAQLLEATVTQAGGGQNPQLAVPA